MTAHQEPLPAALGGNSVAAAAKRYWLATRPPFLSASAAPVIMGSAYGAVVAGRFAWLPALLALITTMIVHAAANALNDVGDENSGTDRANVDRIYPYTGRSRFIQNEVLTPEQMRRCGFALLGAGAGIGLALAAIAGPTVKEVPEIAADAIANKRTWPVRVGVSGTRWIYVALHTIANLATIVAVSARDLHPLTLVGIAAVWIMAMLAAHGIVARTDRRSHLTRSIAATLRIHLLGSMVLLLGIPFA
jgi:1,4-dihydroxy-2-naphthoate octaprenyltransferase